MHVLAISRVSDPEAFWASMKQAHARLPAGAQWLFAIASVDGTRAVNVIAADSVDGVSELLEAHGGPFGTTECLEADAGNAVGLAG